MRSWSTPLPFYTYPMQCRTRPIDAAALLLPASICLCLAWASKAAASHVRVVHFQRLSSQCNSRAKPSPTDLLSAAAFRCKSNLCRNYAMVCISSAVHIISSAVRCFAFPLRRSYAIQRLCHATSRRAIADQISASAFQSFAIPAQGCSLQGRSISAPIIALPPRFVAKELGAFAAAPGHETREPMGLAAAAERREALSRWV